MFLKMLALLIQTSTPTTNGKCQLQLVYHSVQCKQITNSKITIPESNPFGGNRAISSLISILQVYHESQHHPTPFMGWFVFFFRKHQPLPPPLANFACCYINLEPQFWRRLCASVQVSRNIFFHPQVLLSRWTAFKTFLTFHYTVGLL